MPMYDSTSKRRTSLSLVCAKADTASSSRVSDKINFLIVERFLRNAVSNIGKFGWNIKISEVYALC